MKGRLRWWAHVLQNEFQCLQGEATLFWDKGYGFLFQKQAASAPGQGSWSGWCCAVRPPTDQPPQAQVFLAVGVEAFVPDCLLDGTGQRWRCGERRKTTWWTSVVRAQIHRFVVCYIHSHGRTQAAGVYRIDGMSARRPPCRVCPAGSMPGCIGVERSPGGRRWWLRGVQNHHRQIADDSRD